MSVTAAALVAALALSGSPFGDAPRTVARLPRAPSRQLAVSPDGTQVYVEGDNGSRVLVDVATGQVAGVTDTPAWAADYWEQKSSRANPANPSELIELQPRTIVPPRASTRTPDTIGTSPTGTTELPWSESDRQVIELKLRNRVIGSFDKTVAPGLTFGWAPELIGWIAYRDDSGRLAVLDAAGRVFVAANTHDVWVPAWTADARHIFFVERHGRDPILAEIAIDATPR